MLGLIALLTLIVNISADYGDYGYNNYNNHGYGYQKGNVNPYNPYPYKQRFHGPYVHQYDYQTPVYKNKLPPIIKYVKQPVCVDQPVIIKKIPVIHKRKQVTVKNQPPIYDVKDMPTVIEKDVGVDVMPTIEKSHVMEKEVFETPEIVNEGMGVDVMRGVKKAPEFPKEGISEPMIAHGVNGMDKPQVISEEEYEMMYGLDKRMKGIDEKDVMRMKDIRNMKGLKDMNAFEVMREIMKGMVDMKDEDFGGYNKKDFDVEV